MTLESLYADLNARVSTLEREVQILRDWRHDMPSTLITPIQNELQSMRESLDEGFTQLKRATAARPVHAPATGERRHLTAWDFWLVSGTATATATLLFGLLKLLGKL